MSTEREWREIAETQGTRLLRLRVALHILRAFGSDGVPRSAPVTRIVHGWIDAGMEGPLPWPDDPGFAAWAAREGLGKVAGHIGHWFTPVPASEAVH